MLTFVAEDGKILGMSVMELVAAGLGVVSVWLTARQNVWAWPIGAVMVAMYAVIFWRERLYADAGLQVVFFASQLYGWREWRRGRPGGEPLPVARTPAPLFAGLFAASVAGAAALGAALAAWTNQDVPYWDSGIAAFSLAAQWMMARKYLECWLVWVGVDAVAVGVYWHKGLHPTAALYALFLVLAIGGYVAWRRSLSSPRQAPA